jgi:hypothetical protein
VRVGLTVAAFLAGALAATVLVVLAALAVVFDVLDFLASGM